MFRWELRYGCFAAPEVGKVQTTKPGWSAVVKNKEVVIRQVLYEGLEDAGNRSCERGKEQTHIVLMIEFSMAPEGNQHASALHKIKSIAWEKT